MMTPAALWKATRKGSGIERPYFDEYFAGREKAYALKVSRPRRYPSPLELPCHYGIARPPQSFRYQDSGHTDGAAADKQARNRS